MKGIRLYIQTRFESLDVKHFKDQAIKLALAFLNNFETAFIQKITSIVRLSEMFANKLLLNICVQQCVGNVV